MYAGCPGAAISYQLSAITATCSTHVTTLVTVVCLGPKVKPHLASRKYAVIACIVTCICDALMIFLAEDDRVALHFAELLDIQMQELMYARSLPDEVWKVLVQVTKLDNLSWQQLRSESLFACMVFISFLEMRGWSQLRRYPWKLVTGDIDASLNDLLSRPIPRDIDALTKKIYQLQLDLRHDNNIHLLCVSFLVVGFSAE